jgi:hypothetical protein
MPLRYHVRPQPWYFPEADSQTGEHIHYELPFRRGPGCSGKQSSALFLSQVKVDHETGDLLAGNGTPDLRTSPLTR